MEVVLRAEYDGFAGFHTLAHVCPLPRELDASFDCLRARIHREHHVVSEHGGDRLCKLTEDGVVERSRGKRKLLRLLDECCDYAGMAMSLNSVLRAARWKFGARYELGLRRWIGKGVRIGTRDIHSEGEYSNSRIC